MRFKALMGRAAAAALFTILVPSPARAAGEDFQNCDGYGSPNRNGDGMTRAAGGLFGLFVPQGTSGNTRRQETTFGAVGIAACDGALADSRLQPAQILRRASLLRARGAHRLAAGDHAGAIADFDLSQEAAAPADDLYYRRSLGIGTRLLRARALTLAGRNDEAAQEARAVIEARPTDTELGTAAARVLLAATNDWTAYTGALRGLARYNPTLFLQLYATAMLRGDFAGMDALYPHILFTVPQNRGGFVVAGREQMIGNNFITRVEVDGAHAFALAATGRGAAAESALAALAESIDASLTPPQMNLEEAESRAGRNRMAEYQLRLGREAAARERLAFWRRAVEMRIQAADGRGREALAQLASARIAGDSVGLNIVEAIAAGTAELRGDVAPLIEQGRNRVSQDLDKISRLPVEDLIEHLPSAEVQSRVPSYNGASDGILSLDGNGFMSRRAVATPGAVTVKFASNGGTLSTVAELALLRAAEMARERRMPGFIILGRRRLERTSIVTMYGRVLREEPSGHESEVDILFVDPAALPVGFEQAGWRVLDAEQVWAQLSPLYVRTASSENRSGRRR
jgi:tetratricopeptide (TPR) repeat protein